MRPANRLRITGGRHRGAWVRVPRGARPTSARAREALFSIWGPRLAGARVADLFAGSGIVGLEALSRGASHVRFVEASRTAAKGIRESCERLIEKDEGSWEVLVAQIPGPDRSPWCLPGPHGLYDLVFVDAPYRWSDYESLLRLVLGLIHTDGAIALEHSTRAAAPLSVSSWQRSKTRSYGETTLSFYDSSLSSE